MRKSLSNKTIKTCYNSRKKINTEMVHTVVQGGNTIVFSKLCTALLYLGIDMLEANTQSCKDRAIRKALLQIGGLRREASNDPINYISGEEVRSYLDFITAALEAGIVPMSDLLLGTDENSIAEFERIESELKRKRIIRGQ